MANSAGIPSPVSPSFPSNLDRSNLSSPSPLGFASLNSAHPYLHITHLFSIPLRLSSVCRRVHDVLTGDKAVKRMEGCSGVGVDSRGLQEIWDRLDGCWEEFEGVRRGGLANGDVDPMVDRFVSAWQVIFPPFERSNYSYSTCLIRLDIYF